MNDKYPNFLSLFASSSTLICCALPAIFVALGAGASFASLLSVFPFLITLSNFKGQITLFALFWIIVAGLVNYRTYHMPCPADPELGRVCKRNRESLDIFIMSLFLFFYLLQFLLTLFLGFYKL